MATEENGVADWLLFGLGNPGSAYTLTRHNLGWQLIDLLVKRYRLKLSAGRADYFFARTTLGDQRIHLIKPTTYMNLSGRAVRQYLAIERPEVPKVVIAVDDIALPLGRLRMRPRGSAGGHNGLRSVIESLRNEDFARIRMGVGSSTGGQELSDYVLDDFDEDERELAEALLQRAANAFESWVQKGPEKTMGRFNG